MNFKFDYVVNGLMDEVDHCRYYESHNVQRGFFMMWYRKGLLHRNVLPAIISDKGSLFFYQNGMLHRDRNLPAILIAEGEQYWFLNGMRYIPHTPEEIDRAALQYTKDKELKVDPINSYPMMNPIIMGASS
jgi:hypothetical protein